VKNRMREFRQSGSVRDGDGNVPIYSAMTPSWVTLKAAIDRADCLRLRERGRAITLEDIQARDDAVAAERVADAAEHVAMAALRKQRTLRRH